jgi:hypothetical protein
MIEASATRGQEKPRTCSSGSTTALGCSRGPSCRCRLGGRCSGRRGGAQGGLGAIAISHPPYYGSMVEWSRAFGGVPIYVHAAEREWVLRPDPAIVF